MKKSNKTVVQHTEKSIKNHMLNKSYLINTEIIIVTKESSICKSKQEENIKNISSAVCSKAKKVRESESERARV